MKSPLQETGTACRAPTKRRSSQGERAQRKGRSVAAPLQRRKRPKNLGRLGFLADGELIAGADGAAVGEVDFQ